MLTWKVIYERNNKIEWKDIFKGGYLERIAKELKDELGNRDEWEKHFKTKLMSIYWCRSEYEIIITSWPPFISRDNLDIMNTEAHNQSNKVRVNALLDIAKKINVFDQLNANWEVFADYVWRSI